MNICKRLLKLAQVHPKGVVAIMATVLLLFALVYLNHLAEQEANARKSPETLSFEKEPEQWLAREMDVSHLRKALDGGQLSAVGLAADHPGLVLYTLNNGEKASTVLPGCTAQRCGGTVMDKLDA